MSDDIQVTKQERSVPERAVEGPTFRPQVDIVERSDALVVTADLPGVAREDVDVTLESGVLTIEATPKVEEKEGLSPSYAEYEVGKFYRSFTLGSGLDAAGIEANLKDGVLRLTVPKAEAHRPRKIEITGE